MKVKFKKIFNSLKNFSTLQEEQSSSKPNLNEPDKANNQKDPLEKQGLGKIQSFTFYIPSPPERKSGYREKQFDKLFYEFINLGFEIISVQTVSNSGSGQSGMWFICIVRATTEEANHLHLESFLHDNFEKDRPKVEKKESIEGIFQIE